MASDAVAGDAEERLTVAMIGLGQMGGHMCDHVAAAGHDVRAFDLSEAALDVRVAAGATRARSAADAATGADVVGITVINDAQVRAVLDGPDGVLAVAAPGTVVAVHSTVTVEAIHEFAAMAGTVGVHLIDAGISGGETGSRAGTLVTMVGGDPAVVAVSRPVLESFSKEVLHAGPLGTGMALKIARNLVGYIMMTGVHEGMLLARAAGVDLADLEHVLRETNMDAQVYAPFAFGGPEALPADAPEEQRAFMAAVVALGEKDLDNALDLARSLEVSLPLTDDARREFDAVLRSPR
jgi:3-hydroxyisobutyrate dehydrogenase-like beta-hydroxyacid dehydrogenase